MAEASLRQYFKDPTIDLSRKAALAALLYSKAIKQTSEQTIKLLASNEQLILDKYTKPTQHNVLDMITGSTASEIINISVVG